MIHDARITLAHGNGGRRTRELIEEVFAAELDDPDLDVTTDAAHLPRLGPDLAVSTDGFVVQPLEFPGGSIGTLAVHGTVNDLAVAGAEPRYLTLGAIIEEGLETAQLVRIAASAAASARSCGVRIVAGDTKVVPRGHGGGLYLTTTGIGVVRAPRLGRPQVRPGDVILVSGPVGDHGVAVLLARDDFDLRGSVASDCASVLELARAAWVLDGVRFLRDPTRGGLATVAHELAAAASCTVLLNEETLPVRSSVRSFCDILGFDPLYLACEGRVVAAVDAGQANGLLAAWRGLPGGEETAVIGRVETGPARAELATELGGLRLLPELEDDPLPRIC